MAAKEKKVVLVRADDWEAIYIDGKLEIQNHQILCSDLAELLESKGMPFAFSAVEMSKEQQEDVIYGEWPVKLKDVKQA